MKKLLLFAAFGFLLASCSKDNNDVDVPTTYEFTRDGKTTVDVSGQWKRLDMHSVVKGYAGKASSEDITAAQLLKYASNDGNPFTTAGAFFSAEELNTSGKQIWNKVSASSANKANQTAAYTYFKSLFADLERLSKVRETVAKDGVAGLAGGKRLVDEKGYETVQVMSKSLMGALQLDQMVNNYLSDAKLDVENDKVKEGKNYTEMEHHWDEAFGYTGLPLDPATNYSEKGTDNANKYRRFWSGYLQAIASSKAGKTIKTDIYNAFLKGRTAIVNKDTKERNAQRDIIRNLFGKACAIRAVHYLKEGADALTAKPGDAGALHETSEGIGFVYALSYTHTGASEYQALKAAVTKLTTLKSKGLYAEDAPALLLEIAEDIAKAYDFKVEDTL